MTNTYTSISALVGLGLVFATPLAAQDLVISNARILDGAGGESGDVATGSTVYKSLFAIGLLLFIITAVLNVFSSTIVAKFREAYD